MPTIDQSSDFLFIFEAIQCNPNGDPDQENKPRMDYSTQTNLVTDVRLKRTLRDYLRLQGKFVFVDMESDVKVSVGNRLKSFIDKVLKEPKTIETIFEGNDKLKDEFTKLLKEAKDGDSIFVALQNGSKKPGKGKAKQSNEDSGEESSEEETGGSALNRFILTQLVRNDFVDVRMFGSAFAVKGFTRAFTGAIQINWGYSLNKVEIMDSSTLVAIMSDGNSTFGKDWRVHYSLPAFHGTINKYAAKTTGLTAEDVALFRTGLWECLPAMPTRTKLNQYPKLYVELVYNDTYNNGRFGDLRNHISITEQATVRNFSHITVDASKLTKLIQENLGEGKPLQRVIVNASEDMKPYITDILALAQPHSAQ